MLYSSNCSCSIQTSINTEKCNSDYYKDASTIKFYKSSSWRMLRTFVITNCHGIDLYSYYTHGIIECGRTVHHIVPINECWGKRYELGNLIYLTESNHQLIHNEMNKSNECRVNIQNKLRKYLFDFSKGVGGVIEF